MLLAFFPGGIGGPEMIIFALIALLLFGKRLPEVARSLGKGIVEFKRGIHGIESEVRSTAHSINDYSTSSSTRRPDPEDDDQEWTAPKFEPPTSEPVTAGEQKE